MDFLLKMWLESGPPTALDFWATPLLSLTLIAASWIDLRSFRLPDFLTLPLVPSGLLLAAWRTSSFPHDQVIGAIVGYAVFALPGSWFHRRYGIEGLGLGDAKLLAGAGAWLGWAALPTVVLISSLTGLLAAVFGGNRSHGGRIAFGPFLAGALLAHWLIFLADGLY